MGKKRAPVGWREGLRSREIVLRSHDQPQPQRSYRFSQA